MRGRKGQLNEDRRQVGERGIAFRTLREHSESREGGNLVNHQLEVTGIEGLDLRHGVLRSVIKCVSENAGGGNTSGALHAVSNSTGVGEVWEFLAEIHELDELGSE